MRYYCWITNTAIDDKSVLREMFIPTQDELIRNQKLNDQARIRQQEIQNKKNL